MTIEFDSNKIPSRREREEHVLDLHFNQNKNYRQIAKEMKMSVRDIGEIVNRAKQEKERREHKSLAVQEDNNDNSNQEEQEASDEQYSDDYNYEQDRLTDDNAYSEYFRDDFNAGDRFTS
jgi:transposase